jgi:polysaccharide biosynthesis transport protein
MGNLIRTESSYVVPASDGRAFSPQTVPPNEPFEIRRLLMVLLKRKLLILLITLAVLVPAALYSFLTTPTYRSTVRIQLQPESVKVLPFSSISDSLFRSPDFELYMKTQDVLMRSPALASRTLERLRRRYAEQDLPLIGGGFSAGLSVERVAGSQIVSINYVSLDPEFSSVAANTIADEFVNLHFERKLETTRKATTFLDSELQTLRKNVEQAETELVKFGQEHSLLDTNENQQNVIRERFGLLSSEMSRAQTNLLTTKAEYDELARVGVDDFPASLRGVEISALETAIRSAEQELSRLRTQFGENWPEVVRRKNDLAVLYEQLQTEKTAALDRARRDVLLRLNTAQSGYELLSQQFKEQEQLVYKLNEASIFYNSLRRDLEASEQLYQGLLQRLKETGVDPGLDFGNIHITDHAVPSRVPYQPQPFWNISLALLLGLSAGTALAFFLDYTDTAFRSPDDLERIGIPVLGWIPAMAPESGRKGAIAWAASSNGGSLLQLQQYDVPAKQPANGMQILDSRARESYRSLCASLLLSRAEQPAGTILITSAVPREGKTTTAMNLGVTLAETGAPTLLIDADFRNPSLSSRFKTSNGTGLSVHLAGGDIDIRFSQLLSNLYILPAGPQPPNPVALFSAPRFAETLARLKGKFRFIVLDGPPVLSVAETQVLASKVDGVILVVRAGETPKEVVSRANLHLARAGACMLGAAINHLDMKDPTYAYYSKYYYGYEPG